MLSLLLMMGFYCGFLEGLSALGSGGSWLWRSKCFLRLIGEVRISRVRVALVKESLRRLSR